MVKFFTKNGFEDVWLLIELSSFVQLDKANKSIKIPLDKIRFLKDMSQKYTFWVYVSVYKLRDTHKLGK